MRLVIAEKAELARAIARAVAGAPAGCRIPFEGAGYRVVALSGHALDYDEPADIDPAWADRGDLSVLPILPDPWPQHVKPGCEGLIREVRRGLAECDSVVHAGDPDDEGQLLVDEVLDRLGWEGPVERVYINDNLDASIRRAFERAVDNAAARANGEAARARRIADFCFGVNESRLIAARCGRGVAPSVGRVQTPTLGLVVRRDEEIMGHRPREHYRARAMVSVDGGEPVEFRFRPDPSLADPESGLVLAREPLWAALAGADGSSGTAGARVERKRYPAPLPYNLTDLTADMSRRHRMSAKRVLDATQALRDGPRAITYNRSDCNYLPLEAHAAATAALGAAMANIGASWGLDFSIRGRCFDDSLLTAHTAIVPQASSFDASALPRDQRLVYEAIVERYAMQFLPAAEADVSTMEVPLGGGVLAHVSKRAVRAGWKAVRGAGDGDDRDVQEGWVDAGERSWKIVSHEIEAAKTKPPRPYTEGALVKDMSRIARFVADPAVREVLERKDAGKRGEHGGIGTTATRAGVIESLKAKGYLEEMSGKIVSTNLGRAVYRACPDDIKGADLTARWYLLCEEVRAGRAGAYAVAESVCEAFRRHRDTAYEGVEISREEDEVARCPLCGAPVIDRGPRWKKLTCSSNRYERAADGTWSRTDGCGFELWKEAFGHALTRAQVRALIERGRTRTIKGLKGCSGKAFDAALVLEDAATGRVVPSFPARRGKR